MKQYKIIHHTADLRIKIFGSDIKDLFINSGYAYFDLVIEKRKRQLEISKEIKVEALDLQSLFVSWLNELIYLFTVKELVVTDFYIKEITFKLIKAKLKCLKLSPQDSIKREIKAATYHKLEISSTDKGSWAHVIFDV